MKTKSLVALVCLFAVGSAVSNAGVVIEGHFAFNVTARNANTGEALPGFDQAFLIDRDGLVNVSGISGGNGYYDVSSLSVSGNIDPSASLAYGIRNVAAIPIAFSTSLVVPIAPVGPSSVIGGSTGGSVTDADGVGGVSVTNNGVLPFFSGIIDGATVLSLHAAPFNFTVPAGTGLIPPVTAGLPGPTLPGPAAAASIAVVNDFVLSPGDSISASNFFQVEAIPEPSAFLYGGLMSALAGCGYRLKRRFAIV